MTPNIVESLNAMLIVKRENPMTSIFNSIIRRFREKFRKRHGYVFNYKENKMVFFA